MNREIKFRAWDKERKKMLFSSKDKKDLYEITIGKHLKRCDNKQIVVTSEGVLYEDKPNLGYYCLLGGSLYVPKSGERIVCP